MIMAIARFSRRCRVSLSICGTLPHMFTGERIVPGGKYHVTYQQSLFAYEFARQRAKRKRVLDVGSGEGYGVNHLVSVASRVVGFDAHGGTIETAQKKYRRANLAFVVGTLEDPPQEIAGQQFDIVCCFQTIEHVADQDSFLEQVKAFVSRGGMVMVTTPNKDRFSGFNPYHVKELTPPELADLMYRHFKKVELYGIFGNEAVVRYREVEQRVSDAILRLDVLKTRYWLPRPIVLGLYALGAGLVKLLSLKAAPHLADEVTLSSFWVDRKNLSSALDLLAVGEVE